MKNYIPELVQRTPEQLKKIKEQLFLNVAMKLAYNNIDAQYLVTSQRLHTWFYTQIEHLETEFIQSMANSKLLTKSKHELFIGYILKIEKVKKLLPRVLLNSIRKAKGTPKYEHSNFHLN